MALAENKNIILLFIKSFDQRIKSKGLLKVILWWSLGSSFYLLECIPISVPLYLSIVLDKQQTANSDAFGNGTPTGTATVNLRFAGQYFDKESDLHYNWNRYYDPDTGRYISSDPIGLEGGLNTFAYVGANPVMYVDPEGHYAAAIPVLGGVLLGGAIAEPIPRGRAGSDNAQYGNLFEVTEKL